MRYATSQPVAACQARSLRIGRCARCHAPVLSGEEHYGSGQALVHGACGLQSLDPPGDPRIAAQRPRRLRRRTTASGLQPPVSTGKL